MAPIVRAFVISLVLHFLFFSSVEVGNRLDLWRYSPLAVLARLLNQPPDPTLAEAQARSPTPAVEEPQEIPMIFVDVDPSQATADAPESTPFYSPVNSLAGNPSPADELDPEFDGRQDRVLKTVDTQRSAVTAAQPLQPAPAAELVRVEPVEEARLETPVAPPTPAREEPRQRSVTVSPQPLTLPGDLESVRPPAPSVPAPTVVAAVEPAPPPRERPRTVAQARALNPANPNSALLGEKMRQEGGVRRLSLEPSIAARGTPLGNYDAKLVAAVQQCWFNLLHQQRYTLDRVGRVVLRFKLTADGRITDMETVESDVGEIYTLLCQLAVTKPAPFEGWPDEVRKLFRDNFREVTFTFYY